MRIASSIRSTPSPVRLAVSSACVNDMATNEIAPRLYTSSGCGLLDRLDQRGEVGEVTGDELHVRELLLHRLRLGVVLPLHEPEHLVALGVEELGEVLAVLAGDAGDQSSGH